MTAAEVGLGTQSTLTGNRNNMESARGTKSRVLVAGGDMSSPNYYKPAPTEIVYGPMQFLITDRPSDLTMKEYLEELKKHHVCAVIRVCEPTYKTEPLTKEGINVLDWEFADGKSPPPEIIKNWLDLVKDTFGKQNGKHDRHCLAVHCVAGLGRAPIMVAIALIEAGCKYEDCVELIRRQRRGALNQKQLDYLQKYKPTGELKKTLGKSSAGKDCCIM